MEGKRYYWLKLRDDIFSSKRIKKLRKMAGGDTYTIIYLKMQLLALKTDGVLTYTGLENSFAAELALDLDEQEDNVTVTVSYLLSCGLLETNDDTSFFLPYVAMNTGSETASTQRWREWRDRQKLLESNTAPTQPQQNANVEKEIEKEKRDTITITPPPALDDIAEYCKIKKLKVNPKRFYEYYSKLNWHTAEGKPIDDWYALLEHWDKTQIQRNATSKDGSFDTDDFFDAAVRRAYQ